MATDKILDFLYNNSVGRGLLQVCTARPVSKAAGSLLDAKFSTAIIDKFIEKNNIDMSDYEETEYKSYNDFFTRKIKKGARPINYYPSNFISPCDSRLTVYKIDSESKFNIKKSYYTVNDLLRNKKLSAKYDGGYCMIFRLAVDNYHRYCYIDNGKKSRNVKIPGVLHTVQPIATNSCGVYKENSREYTVLRTDNFDDVVHMEVGAMLVGRIKNHHEICKIKRGQEKGMFEFGGSTIILLVKEGVINIREDIIVNSKKDIETPVKMGEVIATTID